MRKQTTALTVLSLLLPCLHSTEGYATIKTPVAMLPLATQTSPRIRNVRQSRPALYATSAVATSAQQRSTKPNWRRRVIRSVFKRHSNSIGDKDARMKDDEINALLSSMVMTEQQSSSNAAAAIDADSLFKNSKLTEEYLQRFRERNNNPSITTEDESTTEEQEHSSSSLLNKLIESRMETILHNLIDNWTQGAYQDLNLDCDPSPKLRELFRQGVFSCSASANFENIKFAANNGMDEESNINHNHSGSLLQVSSGQLEANNLSLNLLRFTRLLTQIPRFAKPFEFVARDVVMTQEDLFNSNCIRNGLCELLRNILHRRVKIMTTNIEIEAIQILPSSKLSVRGSARTKQFGTTVAFEVRTGLETASRGHILTFPGLEIALSPKNKNSSSNNNNNSDLPPLLLGGLFVPILPEITLDLGHNAQIQNLRLNGSKAQLELDARVTITPKHTCLSTLQKYSQDASAYRSRFHFDVGRWLTELGQFSN